MTTAIPANPGATLVSVEYAPDGLSWARICDNEITGWLVPDAVLSTLAAAKMHELYPLVIGELPPPAPPSPVISPRWGFLATPGVLWGGGVWLNPRVHFGGALWTWRPDFETFLDWLATNNGALRKLDGRFGVSRGAYNSWQRWSRANPDLVVRDTVAEERGFGS